MWRTGGQFRGHGRAAFGLAGLVLTVLSGCMQEDEAALRNRLERWFAIGETVSFHATRDCVAAMFELVQMQVKSPLPVANAAPDALRTLSRRGAVAVDDPQKAPDAVLVEIVTADRPLGMGMRRAALEGRMCMNGEIESAFRHALENPRAVVAYDAETATLILLDPRTGLLVAARGAAAWF